MHHDEAAARQVKAETDRPKASRCVQCGEVLDAQRIQNLARVDHVMCADCAFDSMPCTD
jgi:hypothetical protein